MWRERNFFSKSATKEDKEKRRICPLLLLLLLLPGSSHKIHARNEDIDAVSYIYIY
jgi:hypothetical protein